jgi:hypothetical protein
MSLLDEAKVSLRVKSTITDDEVRLLIDAAIDDMRRVGIKDELLDESRMGPMAKYAVMAFCKSRYGLDNSDSEKFWESYQWAVRSMLNSSMNECDYCETTP